MERNWRELVKDFHWGPREWVVLVSLFLFGSILLLGSGLFSTGGQNVLPPFPTRTPLPTFTSTPAATPTSTEIPATPTSTPAAGRIHVVRSGETLFSIALFYNTTVPAIMQANNLSSTTIVPGQELIIP
ncbi:MAG: LysM peptidoglycan-binding domain-containing protein [Chloroflexi bacterium]|nr:LysM peptidoglycan-binding domain-containing protein [Chloroflexota bacterium]